jgi:hypothetical protein
MPFTPSGSGVMASLSKERKSTFRIHWRFKVKLGPRAGETFEGSLHLGRCTKTAAKAKQREIEEWEERVKTGRFDHGTFPAGDGSIFEMARGTGPALPDHRADRSSRRHHPLAGRAIGQGGGEKYGGQRSGQPLCVLSVVHAGKVPDRQSRGPGQPAALHYQKGGHAPHPQPSRPVATVYPTPRTIEEVRRKRRIIVFLLYTGLRNGELCALDVEDLRVDDHERLLHVMGKGQKQRWVPLNRAALSMMATEAPGMPASFMDV